jgi:hypothetical protein
LPDIHQVVDAVSHLSELGNLAGATLAINVGYLGLRRFRYRDEIRKCAADQLGEIGDEKALQGSIKTSAQYKDLIYLARLPDNDGLDEAKRREPIGKYKPKAGWSYFYRFLYARHQDRFVSIFMGAFAMASLVIGGALSIGIWSWFKTFGSGAGLQAAFWMLILGAIIPPVLVYIGNKIVFHGCSHAMDCQKQVAALMADMAKQAAKPPSGTGGLPAPMTVSWPEIIEAMLDQRKKNNGNP